MNCVLLLLLVLKAASTLDVVEKQGGLEQEQGERDPKQLWPSATEEELLSGPDAPLTSSLPNPFDARVGETDASSSQSNQGEQILVEQMNHFLSSMGRKALNGIPIYSSNSGAISSQPEDITPGRPSFHHEKEITDNSSDNCCLFVFFDGSAFYFDQYLRLLTGHYRLMYGSVNGHPHYVARGCKDADQYGDDCSYIWNSGQGWVIGVGTYIGQTKGVVYASSNSGCPTWSGHKWFFLDKELQWRDYGNVVLQCAS